MLGSYVLSTNIIADPPPGMSFGPSLGDILTISILAAEVYNAYKDAPKEYKQVKEDIDSLRITINKAEQFFKRTPLDDDDKPEGRKILKGCQSVLEDLNSLMKKYKTLDRWKRVKLGTEGIAELRARLVLHFGLLTAFMQRFDISMIR